jgi:hypothetical protein
MRKRLDVARDDDTTRATSMNLERRGFWNTSARMVCRLDARLSRLCRRHNRRREKTRCMPNLATAKTSIIEFDDCRCAPYDASRNFVMRILPFALITLAAIGLTVGRQAVARDLFVNNLAGDDLLDGGAQTSAGTGRGPVQTLRQALWLASTGDHISLANTGEPYHESVTLFGDKHSGYPSRPFIIDGNGATLDGSRSVPPDAWRHDHDDVFRFRPERMAFQQLFLDGRPAKRRNLTSTTGGLPELDPLEWAMSDGQIYFRVEPDRLPDQYNPSDANLTVGLTLYKVEHVAIANLFVQGFQLDGINLQDVRSPCTLTQISARGNGRSGIAVCGASRVAIEACLAGNNGQSQLHLEGPSETHIETCDLIPNTGPKWTKSTDSRLYIDGKPTD